MHRQEKYDIGVIVGRFQVAELSIAHKELIEKISSNHVQTLVFVGISPTLGTRRNPLGYTARKKMIQSEFPNVNIVHIMDVPNDKEWSNTLDKAIRAICPIGNICLYGGRDSFIEHYEGCYDTFELEIIGKEEGTQIRKQVGKDILSSIEFRKGIIYSCENQYGKVFPTVDVAVVKTEGERRFVLLGARTKDSGFRFPGGFVDPSDESYESAGLRELGEEFDVEVDIGLKYVCSRLVKDWRYKSAEERILTTLYVGDYMWGPGKPISEFEDSRWIELRKESLSDIEQAHKPLFIELLRYYKKEA